MSADNWAKCPRCVAQRDPETTGEGYYAFRTFREDYEFYGIEDDGAVTASYRGGCRECGLKVEFDYVHPFQVQP